MPAPALALVFALAATAPAPPLSLAARVLPGLYGFAQAFLVSDDVGAQRAGVEAITRLAPRPAGVKIIALTVAGRPAELLVPRGAPLDRAVLYLHGGAYVLGSINTHRGLAAALGEAAGAPVLLIDYRLAPEHPYPAASDDAVAAYRWLRARGLAPGRIVIAGDSAGGGLTLSTALRLRDEGEPAPAALVTFSPWTDLTFSGASVAARAAADPVLDAARLRPHAAAYAAGATAANPRISPLFGDYRGLSPLLIQVGEREILFSDAERVAVKARAAGVAVDYAAWPGMWHVWQTFPVPEAGAALAYAGAFIRAHLR
jgi:acetyl esterase/lipase